MTNRKRPDTRQDSRGRLGGGCNTKTARNLKKNATRNGNIREREQIIDVVSVVFAQKIKWKRKFENKPQMRLMTFLNDPFFFNDRT